MKNYNALRELRNKLFPPKLEFGCEIMLGEKDDIIKCSIIREVDDNEIITNFCPSRNWSKDEIQEILGKPVSIADVLMMLDEKLVVNGDVADVFISGEGDIIFDYDECDKLVKTNIDLSKPLSEQVDVCDEIVELLK